MVDYVEELVKEFKQPKETVETDFKEKMKEAKGIWTDLAEPALMKRAFLRLKSLYRKQMKANLDDFEGIFIGYDDGGDRFGNMRKRAEVEFKKDPKGAIQKGICDVDGVPLFSDPAKQKSYGRKIGEFIARNLYGVATKVSKDSQSIPKKFVLTLSAREVSQLVTPPLFVPVKFRGRVKKESETDMELDNYLAPDVKMEYLKTAGTVPDFEKILGKFYKPETTLQSGKEIVLKGMIDILRVSEGDQYKTITLSPESGLPVSIFMPFQFRFEDIEGLSEQVEVYIWGKVSNKQGNDGQYSINGYGIYVPKEWRVPKPPEVKPEELKKGELW